MRDKKKRITELTQLLDRAARAYEQEDRELMSNFEYDRLYDELKSLEEETGIVLSGSPTQRAGYEVQGELPKERHEAPMLSLDKTKDRDALAAWLDGRKGLLSWKLDGLTIVLTYRDGMLEKAVTRGNGETGEVVTGNVKVFRNVPLTIPYKGDLVIRGEAVIKYSDFDEMNRRLGDTDAKYKNPRNLCSGSVRQLNTEITASRNVYLYVFSMISAAGKEFGLHSEEFEWLDSLGFDSVERKKVDGDNILECIQWFADNISSNDFPSDGLVLIYDDIEYGRSLGRTSKFPRDSIAFKWADEIRETKLLEVEWSASRTGLINPVAIFEPVELEGTTVSRASLHNLSIMEGLELSPGDIVTVYKANMIIPQIAENLTRSGMMRVPEKCPVCGGATHVENDNGVKTLNCANPECSAKRVKLFAHYVSRDAMNIEGLSEATLEKLIDNGMIRSLTDIYRLEELRGRIVEMEGLGEKSCDNLIAAINKSRATIPARFIYALGIPNIGFSNAKLLCRHFKNDVYAVLGASSEELEEIDGIGAVIAGSITGFYENPENRKLVDELLGELRFEQEETAAENALSGMTFVITGSLEKFENRAALTEVIEKLGGKVTGSVTKKTNYLINNDNTSSSTKNKKANELGIQIITEDDFMELAGL